MSVAKLLNSSNDGFSIQIDFKYNESMLVAESDILKGLNDAGVIATEEVLTQFDSDGSVIKMGNQTFTTKGQQEKNYQSPYGEIRISRHVYQSHSGGKTFCPLEHDARIVVTSTPRFAKIVSSKYSIGSTESVKNDLKDNHDRPTNRKTLQTISDAVASVALAKETSWEYLPSPKDLEKVETLSFGLDGTCMQMRADGWREAMAGTITLYNKEGDRIHTTYLASPPEYGKNIFLTKLEESIKKTKSIFSTATTIGLADGAKENWSFLNKLTEYQVIDFYHVTEYLGSYSKVVYKSIPEQKEWLENACHDLKNKVGSAVRLLHEIENESHNKYKKADQEILNKTLSYFKNNVKKMKYKQMLNMNAPIGSGVTEAACKVIVKERMCKAGMRWKNDGAQVVLKLRTMNQTKGHWDFFWNKVDKFGFEMAA